MKKLLFILLLLPAWVFGQSVTPQWRADANGMGYTYVGLGHQDTMWNAAKIRSYIGTYRTYTASNGLTLTGAVFKLGGALTANTFVNFSAYGLGLGDFSTQKAFLLIDPTTFDVNARGGSARSASIMNLSDFGFGFTNIRVGGPTMAFVADTATGFLVVDNEFHKGLKHDVTGINHATWDNNTYVDKKYADSVAISGGAGTYQPLEDQRLSTTNSPSFIKQFITGITGGGYVDVLSQSVSPPSLTNHLRLYADSLNRLSWKNSSYRRTIQVPYPTDMTIRMPWKATSTTLVDSTQADAKYSPIANPNFTGTITGALNKTLTLSNGLTGTSFNNSANVTATADTTILVNKARATANYVMLWGGAQTIAHALTITGSSSVTTASGGVQWQISSAGSSVRDILFQSAGSARWIFRVDATPESGSNVGSDFNINSRSDAGAALKTPLFIKRSTGNVLINSSTDATGALQVTGRIRATQALSGTAHTDSLIVHDNTSKEIKLIGPNALTDGLVGNILSKTADYTIVGGDFVSGKRTILDLYIDATAGAVVITMPSASTFSGYEIYITKTDASVNTVTINTVSGLNTLTTQYQGRHFMSNATNWYNH